MRYFLIYTLVGCGLAGSMLGLLLSDNTVLGAVEGLVLGFGVWLSIVGLVFFLAESRAGIADPDS